jgi:hypothetical protein
MDTEIKIMKPLGGERTWISDVSPEKTTLRLKT